MAKNITIFNLLQNVFSEEELQTILTELDFTDTTRKCTVSTLISYPIGVASQEWKSMRHATDVALSVGLVSVDHSSLSKRLTSLVYHITKRISTVIIGKCNRSAKRGLSMKKELMAMDSTTITIGKSRLPLALYHGEHADIKLHISFTNETVIPLQVLETTGLKHDGPMGKQLKV